MPRLTPKHAAEAPAGRTTERRTRRALRSPGVLAAVACLLLTSQAGTARAQQAPPPKSLLQIRLGPLFLTPRLSISNVGIDTNVNRVSPQADASQRKRDFTATVWGGLFVDLAGRRLSAHAEAGAGYVYYLTYTAERAVNPGIFNASVHYRLTNKVTLYSAGGRYAYVKDRPNFEIESRARRLEQDAGIGVRYALTPRLDLDFENRWRRVRYDQGEFYRDTHLATQLDRRGTDQRFSVSYALTPFTRVFGSGRWQQERFASAGEKSGGTTAVGGGFDFTGRGLLSGRAELGQMRFKPRDAGSPGYTGLYAQTAVTLTLRDTTALTVGYERSLAASYSTTQSHYTYDWYQSSLRQSIGRSFDIEIAGQHNVPRYLAQGGLGGPRQTTTTYRASLGHTRRQSRYAVYAEYWDGRTGVTADPQFGYEGWRFGLSLRTSRLSVDSNRGLFANGSTP